MDALGDTDGTTGFEGFLSDPIDVKRKELLDQLTKLEEAFKSKDYDALLVLWPPFEKKCRMVLETLPTTPKLPDYDFDPSDDDWLTADANPMVLDESVTTMEIASVPPAPTPANELAAPPPPPPPPAPANEPVPPPPPPIADQAIAKLNQANTHANEASMLITEATINGSIKMNKASVNHIESCQAQISAAKEALQLAPFHLLQATLINQDESLSQLIS